MSIQLGKCAPEVNRKSQSHLTFRQILESERQAAVERVWEKARRASALRHLAVRQGRMAAARAFGKVKLQAITRAVQLWPGIEVTVDTTYCRGFISVRHPQRGWLHLPPRTPLPPR